METLATPFGELIRDWRQRRRMSQLDLACEAEISTRHLSFLETGRSAPSREMVLHLCEHLETPLRERNRLLLAAGFAPALPVRPMDDPDLGPARSAVERLLKAQEPYRALAVDRGWNLVSANGAVAPLIAGAAPALLEAPVNVLRLSLHPDGLASRIENLGQWRSHLLHRLRRQISETGDRGLADLHEELAAYPAPPHTETTHRAEDLLAVPLVLRSDHGLLSFWSTTLVFGAPLDVTLSELALETFLPADEATATFLTGTV
jgi:transcriptional regulator with XRE-family HTH domain